MIVYRLFHCEMLFCFCLFVSFINSIEASDLFYVFMSPKISQLLYVIFIFGNVFLKYNLNWES
jgi:hypothetical protein